MLICRGEEGQLRWGFFVSSGVLEDHWRACLKGRRGTAQWSWGRGDLRFTHFVIKFAALTKSS